VDTNSNQDGGRVARLGDTLMGRLRGVMRDEGGAAAVFFALALLLLTPLTLGLVDVYMSTTQRGQLQDALDTATLYAARSTATTTQEIDTIGDAALRANLVLHQGQTIVASNFVLDGVKVISSAEITPPGISPQIWNQANLKASSEVIRNSNNVEVALVLDTTGSMASGTKMADLKAAAKELVNVVVQDVQTPYYSKVGIVPYATAVNVGSYATQVRGSVSSGTSTTPGKTTFQFTNADSPSATKKFLITTCVTERTGADAYTDTSPLTSPLGRHYGPTSTCGPVEITPMSTNKTTLRSQIDGLTAAGSTGGHIGVAWGWYMVSPNFAAIWPSGSKPAAYGTVDLLKVVVLMTDGEYNSSYYNGVISKDSTSGSGGADVHINKNASNGHSFDQAQALCAAMKNKGVIVYTVGFQVVNDQRARDLVNGCATDAKRVYMANSGADLKNAFKAIGQEINSLRLSK